jgi:hypothetical protein
MAVWGSLSQSWGDPGPGEYSYDRLVSDIAAWLMRDDLTDIIPSFVSLAEHDLISRLRLRAMLVRATTTVGGDGYESLPSDYLQMYRLTLDDAEIRFAPTARMAGYAEDWRGSAPMYFTVIGESLQFAPVGPTPGGVLEMTYYARPAALHSGQQTNAILQANPALYLYGSLMQSAPFLGDDQRIQTWGTLYNQAADLVQGADDAAEFAGPLVIRSGAWD